MSASPRLLAIALLPSALCAWGCGDSEGGKGRPDVQVTAFDPLILKFQNQQSVPLYVDWSNAHHHLEVIRDGQTIQIDHDCYRLCEDSCSCLTCPVPSPMVRILPVYEALSITWDPVRFSDRVCGEDTTCRCAVSWPLTAAVYDLTLYAHLSADGGEPDPDNPNLLVGATLDDQAASCRATFHLELQGGIERVSEFDCPPTP